MFRWYLRAGIHQYHSAGSDPYHDRSFNSGYQSVAYQHWFEACDKGISDRIPYLQNIVTSIFSSVAPILGGVLADFFTPRSLELVATWKSVDYTKLFRLALFHEWNFLFLIAAFLAFIAVELLLKVTEVGEVHKDTVVKIMRSNLRNNLKGHFLIGNMITWPKHFWKLVKKRTTRKRLAHHHTSHSLD